MAFTIKDPARIPDASGANWTVIWQLLFAAIEEPHEFVCENGPAVRMPEIFTAELLVFDRVTVLVDLAP